MSLIANILRPFGINIKAASQLDKQGWFVRWATGSSDDNIPTVNNNTAMQIATVYGCIRIISEDVAKLPLQIFQKMQRGRTKINNRVHDLLNYQPNNQMSAISFRQTLTAHAIGYGNGYAEIVRNVNGEIESLWILPPDKISPARKADGTLYYEYKHTNGTTIDIPKERIFHIPGFSFDGVRGYNVIHIARQSLGLVLAADNHSSKLFANGTKASGVVETPQTLSETAFNNLKKSIESQISGDNLYKILLLEEGAKFNQVSINPADAQLLEARQFSVPEICRWFRMPPHKVADLSRATFSNIEHQSLEYVADTLMPWFVRWEQAIFQRLFTSDEQAENLYAKHNANALLRGDTKSRYEAYGKGIVDGWMTRNEARELEELNPIDGLDEPLVPLNMANANQDKFEDNIADRITKTEYNAISARIDKAEQDRDKFNHWIKGWFNNHAKYVSETISPVSNDKIMADIICNTGLSYILNNDISAIKNHWQSARQQEIKGVLKCIQK